MKFKVQLDRSRNAAGGNGVLRVPKGELARRVFFRKHLSPKAGLQAELDILLDGSADLRMKMLRQKNRHAELANDRKEGSEIMGEMSRDFLSSPVDRQIIMLPMAIMAQAAYFADSIVTDIQEALLKLNTTISSWKLGLNLAQYERFIRNASADANVFTVDQKLRAEQIAEKIGGIRAGVKEELKSWKQEPRDPAMHRIMEAIHKADEQLKLFGEMIKRL
ncbi:hypothetical protein DRN67_02045 [Candidatus Micrarchaeota archaeon]|mgnify:CR=1 FL=1|nr:MAG: hypothetical protein DRN67_02045 [Candidatus Micrarchaeota archaeon]